MKHHIQIPLIATIAASLFAAVLVSLAQIPARAPDLSALFPWLDAHFGPAEATATDLKVTLLNEKTQTFEKVASGKNHSLPVALTK